MSGRPRRKITGSTFWQAVFLTGKFYIQNDLLNYAQVCAFGFMFSFIPVAIMTMAITLRFLHASPDVVASMFSLNHFIDGIDDAVRPLISLIANIKTFSGFEVFIGFFIVWMARRFFATVMAGIKAVYHQQVRIRYGLSQIIIFFCEILITILISLFLFMFSSARTIERYFPGSARFLNSVFVTVAPNLVSFILCAIIFRVASNTRPKWKFCIFSSFVQNVSYGAVEIFMSVFMTFGRYNVVYGMFAKLIILMTEVWIYFTLFLTFAQYTYVLQHFKLFLTAELYLLPKGEKFGQRLWRKLFSKADFLFADEDDVVQYEAGQTVFRQGEAADKMFYIIEGTALSDDGAEFRAGQFLGERAASIAKAYITSVSAKTRLVLLKIDAETFTTILKKYPAASSRALSF